MRYLMILMGLVLLTACTEPKTPAQGIYLIEGDYAAAVSIESKYDALPLCGSAGAPILCATADIKKTVRKVDDIAWTAISTAQASVRAPSVTVAQGNTAMTTAQSAVAAFTNLVASLGVK